jgi:hypothetical protein
MSRCRGYRVELTGRSGGVHVGKWTGAAKLFGWCDTYATSEDACGFARDVVLRCDFAVRVCEISGSVVDLIAGQRPAEPEIARVTSVLLERAPDLMRNLKSQDVVAWIEPQHDDGQWGFRIESRQQALWELGWWSIEMRTLLGALNSPAPRGQIHVVNLSAGNTRMRIHDRSMIHFHQQSRRWFKGAGSP